MSFASSVTSFIEHKKHELFLACAFLLWCIALWPFLGGERGFVEDAVSYYQHIGFYAEQLGRGVYPLWDPHWIHGSPYTFFLRRMGEVNPAYLFVVFLHKLDIHHFYAYRIFCAVYYLVACLGVYRISYLCLRNKTTACIAFILMLFSSFSSHLFNDYIVILLVPFVWFFVFLIDFYQRQSKGAFLGAMFIGMIMLTTYIPFLMITIISIFTLLVLLIAPDVFVSFWKKFGLFTWRHKIISGLAILVLLYSFTPGVELYLQSKGEDSRFALPGRNVGTSTDSVFGYSKKLVKGGDIITHGRFENMLGPYDELVLDDLYYPIWGLIIFCLGLFVATNRRQIILCLLFVILMFIGMTTVTPVYEFLDKHIFFIKFFRQLHYFLWIVCLPLASLLFAEQCGAVMRWRPQDVWQKVLINVVIIAVHGAWFVLLLMQEGWLWTQQLAVILSALLFCAHINEFQYQKLQRITLIIVLLIVAIPGWHLFSHLTANAEKVVSIDLSYHPYKVEFRHHWYKKTKKVKDIDFYVDYMKRRADLHYASSAFAFIKQHLPGPIVYKYLENRVMLYDRVQYVAFDHPTMSRIAGAFDQNMNVGFVLDPEKQGKLVSLSPDYPIKATPVTPDSDQVKVVNFDLNHVTFETNLKTPKLLVYNDSYDANWRVFIDGEQQELLHANVAFKGVIVPAGQHTVYFRIGSLWEYAWHISVMLACWAMFAATIFFYVRERCQSKK